MREVEGSAPVLLAPSAMTYAYRRFSRELVREDSTFRTGPAPGDRFPPFDLPTVGGGRVTFEGVADRPFLVVLASFT